MKLVLAFLLPTLLGLACWIACCGRPRGPGAWSAALGSAYLAGVLVWGVVLGAFRTTPADDLFARLAPWLGVAAGLALATAWRFAPRIDAAPTHAPAAPSSRSERLAIGATAICLVVALLAIVAQALDLPTLSWDAWNAWLAKSKAWFHAGAMRPSLGYEAWLAAASGSAITTTAPYYPEALPRFALWIASAVGAWDESAVHLAWPLAWVALGLACFGHLLRAGCRTVHAALGAGGLLLLPLVTAHAALAGYADLWLAAVLMLAAFHFADWRRGGGARPALAAVALALLAVAVKLEGAVWFACLAGAALLSALPHRWRWGLLLAGPVAWAIALPFGGLRVPLPGLGLVRLDWGVIDVPARGSMTLAWRPVLDEFAQALFLLPNWSLLWYVAPLVLALRWRVLLQRRDLAAVGAFLALGYAFLFVLFFLTDASAWAENFTSVNRLLLHAVPATVAWLTLLWAAPALPGTARSSAE